MIFLSAMLCSCSLRGTSVPPPDVVPRIDVNKYTGTWYEIASYPNSFQKGCSNTRATYALRTDGKLDVLNECFRNGKQDSAKGKAKIVDTKTNAKLKVTFFWPFYGDYWVIDLGESYEYAVVSNPTRKYLWILSRTPQMDNEKYSRILDRLRQKGFDLSRLVKTNQNKA